MKKTITLEVQGGLVRSVAGVPKDIRIRILNFDVDGADIDLLNTLKDGRKATVTTWERE